MSEVAICNMALSHLGSGKEIASLETEKSEEASACRRFFDVVRDQTLRDFFWPFATKFQALALVENDPTAEYSFSYRVPSDTIRIRRVLSGLRNDSRQSRIVYKVTRDNEGGLIYSDQPDACIEYTFREENTDRWPPDFQQAIAWRLAHYLAPRLTDGDPFRLADRALQMYVLEITRAMASAANEEQPDEHPDSEFIREREGDVFNPSRGDDFLDFFS